VVRYWRHRKLNSIAGLEGVIDREGDTVHLLNTNRRTWATFPQPSLRLYPSTTQSTVICPIRPRVDGRPVHRGQLVDRGEARPTRFTPRIGPA
jgi:hypothetical protein